MGKKDCVGTWNSGAALGAGETADKTEKACEPCGTKVGIKEGGGCRTKCKKTEYPEKPDDKDSTCKTDCPDGQKLKEGKDDEEGACEKSAANGATWAAAVAAAAWATLRA